MERTTRRRHPCQNLSANPFADQGAHCRPWTLASLSPFRRCYYFGNSENRGLDSAAVMGVPFVSPLRINTTDFASCHACLHLP